MVNIRRQALNLSIRELENLIKELKEDSLTLNRKLRMPLDKDRKFLVPIISHYNTSDDWILEH